MLVNADVKALEIVCAAHLFNDKVMQQEIIDKVDIHENNRVAFSLPTRLIAKTLVFRILYGGTEYAFVQDPEFMKTSTRLDYWRGAIERFYTKYDGIRQGHEELLRKVMLTGGYSSPTGRSYRFSTYPDTRGNPRWPRTNILNYLVQGFGADLMLLYRVSFWNKIRRMNIPCVPAATVHDSLLVDTPAPFVDQVVTQLNASASDIQGNFFKLFKSKFDLPITVEIEVGSNYKDMDKI